MKIEAWWIFYGKNAYKMSIDNVPEKFANPTKIDEVFLYKFMTWMICERKEAGFIAMGLFESIARASIMHSKPVAVDGVEYIPEAMSIKGNGFTFTWLV